MNVKQLSKFFGDSIKKYQKEENTSKIGLGIKKNLKEVVGILDYGESIVTDEDGQIPYTSFQKSDLVHESIFSYLLDYSLPKDKTNFHIWIDDITISDLDHFSYLYLFHVSPYFSPMVQTIFNAVTYNIIEDVYLTETLQSFNVLYDSLRTYIDEVTVEEWFLRDLQDNLLKL